MPRQVPGKLAITFCQAPLVVLTQPRHLRFDQTVISETKYAARVSRAFVKGGSRGTVSPGETSVMFASLELHFFVTKKSLRHITEVRVHPCVRWGTISCLGGSQVGLDRWNTFLLLNAIVMAALEPLGPEAGSRDAHSHNLNEASVTRQPRKRCCCGCEEGRSPHVVRGG